jgi:plastocyanin
MMRLRIYCLMSAIVILFGIEVSKTAAQADECWWESKLPGDDHLPIKPHAGASITVERTVTPPPASGGTAEVTIQGFAFNPAEVTVKAGTKVVWTNQDSAGHTVVADDGSWQSGLLAKGDPYARVFDAPGIYAYHCGIHPSMKGTIIVTG